MSTFGYEVGNLADYGGLEQDVISELQALHLPEKKIFTPDWTSCGRRIAYVESLNIASLSFFLRHVATLEGLPDSGTAMTLTRFKHLPYWMTTVWLPIDFDQTPILYSGLNATCLASSLRLLANLEEIRTLSPASLGSPPQCYGNPAGVPKDSQEPEFDCLRWVWYDLNQLGQLSIQHGAPVWGSCA